MRGKTIRDKYGYMFKDLLALGKAADVIDATNVYQESNRETLKFLNKMAEENLLPGAHLEGAEYVKDFFNQIKNGKRGLILCEHYGNMDLPVIYYLLARDGGEEGKILADEMVAIAGMKLNEENPMVRSWAEAFTRIVIYPSRSLAAIQDPEEKAAEEEKSRHINMAAMRAMDNVKKQGRPILVFPAGTRYRPGKPETKMGVREMDSYLRLFDIMLLISENGNVLRINPETPNDMISDLFCEDTVILGAGPIIECKKFRNDILATLEDYDGDKKMVVVSKVMDELQKLHDKYRPMYEKAFKDATGEEPDVEQ
ncbi:MAG: 1-acyl-sn-glycerol-3-phosphate acyltransferase [Treponemataceae bacterium]|nr:1-acyl-sn-glycerol-3-phosphate acyltransferase [Spirochaetales bacterium]MDY6030227.1 1-acyl-sn-glycerol-3-phosphate acyltransferase [Treponemataceae bacterium]